MCPRSIEREYANSSAQSYYKVSGKSKMQSPTNEITQDLKWNFKKNFNDIPTVQEDITTISVLSKLNGWIHVSAKSRNRNHRLAKFGPQENKELNLQNVSNLAPVWMHRENNEKLIGSLFPKVSNKKANKKSLLYENFEQKSNLFSKIEPNNEIPQKVNIFTNSLSRSYKPKIFFEWKEDKEKQSYDKPITSKVGQNS